jgi:monoamine oxidase
MIGCSFIIFIIKVACDTLILGAGPTGLYSALQILKSNPTEKVVIAEKRKDFLTRNYIISIYKDLVPELCGIGGILYGTKSCPFSGRRIGLANNEQLSIKTLQKSLIQGIALTFKL